MKRLVVCNDGTWDKPGIKDKGVAVKSNVELMYNAICSVDGKGIKQHKVYDSGVGTGYSIKDRFAGGITGAGIDIKIKDVYTFLLLNYEPGDEIFLFGFSRGAYTARSLAGFIRNCGILKPANILLVDKAYELYRDRNDYTAPESDLMTSFRRNYCIEDVTRMKFVGVWDTVGALGMPLPFFRTYNSERYKFHDATLSSTIDNAFHALAINEHRRLFKPVLWQKSQTAIANAGMQTMEQRWFTGVHCNVGGGYADRGLSDIALQWLMDKASKGPNGLSLAYDDTKLPDLQIKPDYSGKLRNSYTPMYWFWPPVWRKVLKGNDTNECIDASVYERVTNKGWRPFNLRGIDWEKELERGK